MRRVSMLASRIRVAADAITRNRIRLAAGHLRRGEFRILARGVSYTLRGPVSKTRVDPDMRATMALFEPQARACPPLSQQIDIIIPVYNGLSYLERLFDGLLRNTNSPCRLILVDDASPDPSIDSFLKGIVRVRPNTLHLRNEKNMGFVWSANLAARQAQNHFVILNTDVEVPGGWLQRLMAPILTGDDVASTTPFTNSGVICSFPYPGVNNEMVDGLSVGEVDAFFQRVRPEAVRIELPTAVGFCMGVNVRAWKEVGGFDYQNFHRGYGEENDWSMRAARAGYSHLMVPNLFVYHKHGASFGPAGEKLRVKNLATVLKLYPDYWRLLHEFVDTDPPKRLRRFLLLLIAAKYAPGGTVLITDYEKTGGVNGFDAKIVEERLGMGQAVLLTTPPRGRSSARLRCMYRQYDFSFSLSSSSDLQPLLEWIQPLMPT